MKIYHLVASLSQRHKILITTLIRICKRQLLLNFYHFVWRVHVILGNVLNAGCSTNYLFQVEKHEETK